MSNQITFGVKNVKYAVKSEGSYGTPVALAKADAISLEPTYESTPVYGDGVVMAELTKDQGMTGTLTIVQEALAYEIAMNRKEELATGLNADVSQIDSIEHALYFEVHQQTDGVRSVKKIWLLNVTSGKPGESYTQIKDSVEVTNFDIPLTIRGDLKLSADGLSVYKDANGNEKYVTKISATPDYSGYETFEDAVPEPKAAA
jgi:hypothetical protein